MADEVVLEHSGRAISEAEVRLICEMVGLFPGLSLGELACTVAEHLGWYTAGGAVKADACGKLLVKLEAAGVLELSERQRRGSVRRAQQSPTALTERTAAGTPVAGPLARLKPVRLRVVEQAQEKRLWNEYVERYHRLGYKQPFGYRLRYFIETPAGTPLGCLLLSGAAKALGARDRWIGWSERARLRNLSWVSANSRFLLFPWVRVKNLASHVLALLARRFAGDAERRWGFRPLLLESFVDPRYYRGSCYKAAGWHYVGMTTGEGLVRPGARYHYTTTPKMIFGKPLDGEFRRLLCDPQLSEYAGGTRR